MGHVRDPAGNPLYVHAGRVHEHDASGPWLERRWDLTPAELHAFWPVYGDFDVREHVEHRAIWNAWAGQWDLIEYAGRCVRCHRRTYRVSNGDTDPRGVLGQASSCPVNPREHGVGDAPDIEVPACWPCGNSSGAGYAQLVALATEEARLRAVTGPAGAWHR